MYGYKILPISGHKDLFDLVSSQGIIICSGQRFQCEKWLCVISGTYDTQLSIDFDYDSND